MKPLQAFRALLICALLPASSSLHAQPHDPDVAVPESWQNLFKEGQLSDEEKRGANPCPRPDRGMELQPRRRGARIAICIGRVKSRVVTTAWVKGLDEYGVPLKPDAGARKLAEMEVWLRSLVGKFRIEGEYAVRDGSSKTGGTAECFGIGGGPGVSCVISAKWQPPQERHRDKNLDKALEVAIQPLVLLFGIDPVASQIRVTVLDYRAIRMEGFLVDGAVIFDVKSPPELSMETMRFVMNPKGGGVMPLVTYTWSTNRVAVKQNGDLDVQFLVTPADIRSSSPKEFDLKLRRDRRADAGVRAETRPSESADQ